MSEAPKKIWVDDDVLWGSALELQSDYKKETAYIRADLVDELVDALKWMRDILVVETETDVKAIDRADAALKKLEEG